MKMLCLERAQCDRLLDNIVIIWQRPLVDFSLEDFRRVVTTARGEQLKSLLIIGREPVKAYSGSLYL